MDCNPSGRMPLQDVKKPITQKMKMKTKRKASRLPMTMQFLQDGKEIESAPGEEHHSVVVHLESAPDIPVEICTLSLRSVCDDMVPDGQGGSKPGRTVVVNESTMIYLGKIMGHSLDMYEALQDLLDLSRGAAREGLAVTDLAATMRARIKKALPDLN